MDNSNELLMNGYSFLCDADVISSYADALYSAPPHSRPSFNEFRDMFSSAQLLSQFWLISELNLAGIINRVNKIEIVASWYGLLGSLIDNQFPCKQIRLIDIDRKCDTFVKHVIFDRPNIVSEIADMHYYKYTADLVINLNCEHIENLENWLNLLPCGTIVALQSNNRTGYPGHVNTVNSQKEFLSLTNLKSVLFTGEYETLHCTRFMIIGIV